MLFRLAGEIKHSLVNGPGIRYVVFFQGCPHHCEGCQNPETHDISGGIEADTDAVMERIRKAKFLDGVTLSGGDPLMQPEAVEALQGPLMIWACPSGSTRDGQWMTSYVMRARERHFAM